MIYLEREEREDDDDVVGFLEHIDYKENLG
jgi:hypothetical protein